MKRRLLRLSQKEVVNKKEPGYYPDGGGLYLQVSDSGSKSWLFRFVLNGKERQMGLGPFHTITLAEARAAAVECRKLLLVKIDPIEARNSKQAGEGPGEAFAKDLKAACEIANGKPFVLDHDGRRGLFFDENFCHSAMLLSDPYKLIFEYSCTMVGALVCTSAPQQILMTGLGGGSIAKYCYRKFPAARITVIENNADVIALRDAFSIPQDSDRFSIIHGDATDYLRNTNDQVDVILLDAFKPGSIGEEAERQCYRDCARILKPQGVLAANLWGGDDIAVAASTQWIQDSTNDFPWWCDLHNLPNRILFWIKNEMQLSMSPSQVESAMIEAERLNLKLQFIHKSPEGQSHPRWYPPTGKIGGNVPKEILNR